MTKREKRLYVVIMCFILTLTVALPLMTSAQLTEEWVALYNGQGNGDDSANAIALDLSGNIYVTGFSEGKETGSDYVTIKYDTNGKKIWVKRYNGPGSGWDWANAIALDSSGNIYVTGLSKGNETDIDYATVKYDTNGKEIWVKRYNGQGNGGDCANAIALDSSGNSYVTGCNEGSVTGYDYATVKYDPNGNQLWVKLYNGSANANDCANAIALDSSGNSYVTGYSDGNGTLEDYATVKYDSNGNQLWVARYNSPANGDDRANAIALDSSGNSYVTGWREGNVTGYDYATVKYDPNGNQIWVALYYGPEYGNDQANAIAVDSSGNSYVTGWSRRSETLEDYATVKYDSNGNQIWEARYNGPENDSDKANAIAIDSFGNTYVTGSSHGSGLDSYYATVIYDTDGKELWKARYNAGTYGGASDVVLDSSGYIYVTGNSVEDIKTFKDYATIKYTSLILWVDFFYIGTESGTFTQPYNTLGEAHSVATPGQIISIKAGVTGETGTFDKKVKLVAHDGTVTIGK